MSYNIIKTDGSKLATVEDGSVNSAACDLTLIGKNYSGYGQVVNQNLVKMLENFANIKQPARPIIGQLWYDTINKKLKVYTGAEFKGLPIVESSQTEPTNLKQGDFWYDESQRKLYYYTGAAFTLIGPQFSDLVGTSSVIPAVLKDSDGFSHYVLSHQVQSYSNPSAVNIVAITSNDEFTIDSSNTIAGFTRIRRGFNIAGTNNNGISAATASGEPLLWGTSSDSLRLGGFVAGDYVRRNDPRFDSTVFINSTDGLAIRGNNLKLFIDESTGAQLTTDLTRIGINTTVNGTLYNVLNFDTETGIAVLPTISAGQTTSIGTATKRFDNVFANNFNGALTGNVVGNARTATSATTWTNARTLTLAGDLSGSVSINGGSNVTLTATVVAASSATAAARWTNARTITLGGDLTGSVSIDGSSNVTLNATVGANTIALGTDTVGTYVSKAQASGWGIADGSVNFGRPATEVERGFFEVTLASTSTSIGNTLVFRNGSGDFAAGTINAIATQAKYADLAEKYTADAIYDAGTVVMLGGIAEVTICNTYESENVLGVVSTNPAYLMNSELENGVAIALKGRVPVKVTGLIKKGDILVSSNVPGHAQTRRHGHRTNPWAVIGQALQDFDGDTGVIEMFVL